MKTIEDQALVAEDCVTGCLREAFETLMQRVAGRFARVAHRATPGPSAVVDPGLSSTPAARRLVRQALDQGLLDAADPAATSVPGGR
ncbi:hypothetical protein ACFC1R_32565 [Kitasatospora sp. NPDC056138]|uniref:hypothetical protein n=1 Tax=Kitasatospora sp. NPDC056138 TaxID=3345724 RepID=UPI0035DCA98A